MFSFLGRGICKWKSSNTEVKMLLLNVSVTNSLYLVGVNWFKHEKYKAMTDSIDYCQHWMHHFEPAAARHCIRRYSRFCSVSVIQQQKRRSNDTIIRWQCAALPFASSSLSPPLNHQATWNEMLWNTEEEPLVEGQPTGLQRPPSRLRSSSSSMSLHTAKVQQKQDIKHTQQAHNFYPSSDTRASITDEINNLL